MAECVFCEMIAGRTESSYVYEDELVVAALDIRPVTPGHTLVMPRSHLPFLEDLEDDVAPRMFDVARGVAAALRASGIRCEGVNMFLADGKAAFQEVFHSHLHVFPRYEGDSFRISADWSTMPEREELDALAALIGEAMDGGGEGGI